MAAGKAIAATALLALAVPASAQFSDSYYFLKAIRDKDGAKVNELIQGGGGNTLINTRDYTSGEGAIHIVVKRRDDLWLQFLLGQGANPNLRDKEGNTPLGLCAQLGFVEGINTLISNRADVNMGNDRGETPLIIAVQNRDLIAVKALLAAGADPNKPDHIAGMTARDYAARDTRSGVILRAIDEAPKVTTAPKPRVAGPGL